MQNHPPLEIHTQILRDRIPEKFGFDFNRGIWNSGFVVQPGHTFLFVTLEKKNMEIQHQYKDGFFSTHRFHWQSQNRTKQDSKHGRLIRNHESMEECIHLFVRPSKKVKNKTCPFTYCGLLKFLEWHSEQPINVLWHLVTPLNSEVIEQLQLTFEGDPRRPASQEQHPTTAFAAEPKVLEADPTSLSKQVISGKRYQAQKERYSRFQISDDLVVKLLSLTEHSGGTVSLKALSAQSGLSSHRLFGAISTLQKLFNIDGLRIVWLDRDAGHVSANKSLLRNEFGET